MAYISFFVATSNPLQSPLLWLCFSLMWHSRACLVLGLFPQTGHVYKNVSLKCFCSMWFIRWLFWRLLWSQMEHPNVDLFPFLPGFPFSSTEMNFLKSSHTVTQFGLVSSGSFPSVEATMLESEKLSKGSTFGLCSFLSCLFKVHLLWNGFSQKGHVYLKAPLKWAVSTWSCNCEAELLSKYPQIVHW